MELLAYAKRSLGCGSRVAKPSSYALAATAAPICADMARISLKAGNNCLLARCSGLICEASDSAAARNMSS